MLPRLPSHRTATCRGLLGEPLILSKALFRNQGFRVSEVCPKILWAKSPQGVTLQGWACCWKGELVFRTFGFPPALLNPHNSCAHKSTTEGASLHQTSQPQAKPRPLPQFSLDFGRSWEGLCYSNALLLTRRVWGTWLLGGVGSGGAGRLA